MTTTIDDRPAVAVPQGEEEPSTTASVGTLRRQAATDPLATPLVAPRRAGPTFDHFVLSQLPLALSVALIFGIIAFAAVRYMPAGGAGSGTAAPAAAAGAGTSGDGDAPITAFSSEPVTQQISVAADPNGALKWDKATYEAQAGDVTFVVTNKSVSTHNFVVEGRNVQAQSKNFGANTTNTYTIKGLKPGEYLIVCTFPGHREGGMVAKLIVR